MATTINDVRAELTGADLLSLRALLVTLINGGGDSQSLRAQLCQPMMDKIAECLDAGGYTVIEGVLVPNDGTFNDRTGQVNGGDSKPGDRVWTKAKGWTIT